VTVVLNHPIAESSFAAVSLLERLASTPHIDTGDAG
jgi:hypothetical protein